MTRGQRIEKLHTIMSTKLLLTQLPILEESHRLNEDLRIDSVMMMQLLVWIEVEFCLSIPEEEVDPRVFGTVGTLLDFMDRLTPVGIAEELGK
ncbi:petrobactin biosynthesis protein AsbD [Paenibacillus qinlingensis]|uniref:petrobactin biosynthesis protein AsbD n=1 Tax=Paenibacillus qinlingensis TaxID=1837343 RepID=UPI0015651949|nr:petrobactin biosynthesis protein AsbD [Paenibacillus qinlingensis]NQX61424.1 petrobactin biosynthesis protein AsbD [Paenibacillus qinlingensis]